MLTIVDHNGTPAHYDGACRLEMLAASDDHTTPWLSDDTTDASPRAIYCPIEAGSDVKFVGEQAAVHVAKSHDCLLWHIRVGRYGYPPHDVVFEVQAMDVFRVSIRRV